MIICEVYLKARDEKALVGRQKDIAALCQILVRGLAQTGIIALIDEATGYQYVRDRLALQEILDKFLLKEFAAWAKRFPDDFYREIFRLRKWQWRGMSVNRPLFVGKLTNDLVYERVAPGVLEALKERNPKDEHGRRKGRHHQLFTEEIGHPALAQHLHAVITLMRASDSWVRFYKMLNQALPKRGQVVQLEMQVDQIEDGE